MRQLIFKKPLNLLKLVVNKNTCIKLRKRTRNFTLFPNPHAHEAQNSEKF